MSGWSPINSALSRQSALYRQLPSNFSPRLNTEILRQKHRLTVTTPSTNFLGRVDRELALRRRHQSLRRQLESALGGSQCEQGCFDLTFCRISLQHPVFQCRSTCGLGFICIACFLRCNAMRLAATRATTEPIRCTSPLNRATLHTSNFARHTPHGHRAAPSDHVILLLCLQH